MTRSGSSRVVPTPWGTRPLTGLYFLRERYLDPRLGRFWTRDPQPLSVFRSDTLNAYAYVGNNPLVRFDPSGRENLLSQSIAVKITAVIAAFSIANAALILGGVNPLCLLGCVSEKAEPPRGSGTWWQVTSQFGVAVGPLTVPGLQLTASRDPEARISRRHYELFFEADLTPFVAPSFQGAFEFGYLLSQAIPPILAAGPMNPTLARAMIGGALWALPDRLMTAYKTKFRPEINGEVGASVSFGGSIVTGAPDPAQLSGWAFGFFGNIGFLTTPGRVGTLGIKGVVDFGIHLNLLSTTERGLGDTIWHGLYTAGGHFSASVRRSSGGLRLPGAGRLSGGMIGYWASRLQE